MKHTRLAATAAAARLVVTVGLSSLFGQSNQQPTPPAKPELEEEEEETDWQWPDDDEPEGPEPGAE
jgi:hypothetical protein